LWTKRLKLTQLAQSTLPVGSLRVNLIDTATHVVPTAEHWRGRLSVTELADRVGLSLSPCHRRLKALEDAGAILGYHARLAPAALGLNFAALVFVTLREVTRQPVADFEAALGDIPQIVEAQRLFGDPDYLLHVVAKDLPAFQKLYDEQLTSIPNVKRLSSTLVMKEVIQDRMLPM